MSREYLVTPKLLPVGTVNLVGGSAYAGKSLFVAHMLRSLVGGGAFPGPPEMVFSALRPEEIAVFMSDRGKEHAGNWLSKLGLEGLRVYDGLDKPGIEVLRRTPGVVTAVPPGIKLFQHYASTVGSGVKLIVLDIMEPFVGGDVHNGPRSYEHFRWLQHICILLNLTILGVTYAVKTKPKTSQDRYTDPIERLQAAAQVRGGADTVIYVGSEADTEQDSPTLEGQPVWMGRQRVVWQPREGPRLEWLVRRDQEALFQFDSLCTADYTDPNPLLALVPKPPKDPFELVHVKGRDAVRRVYEQIDTVATEAVVIQERLIAAGEPMSRATLYRHLNTLIQIKVIERAGEGAYKRAPGAPATTPALN